MARQMRRRVSPERTACSGPKRWSGMSSSSSVSWLRSQRHQRERRWSRQALTVTVVSQASQRTGVVLVAQGAVQLEEDLLADLLGIVGVAEHHPAQAQHAGPMGAVQIVVVRRRRRGCRRFVCQSDSCSLHDATVWLPAETRAPDRPFGSTARAAPGATPCWGSGRRGVVPQGWSGGGAAAAAAS